MDDGKLARGWACAPVEPPLKSLRIVRHRVLLLSGTHRQHGWLGIDPHRTRDAEAEDGAGGAEATNELRLNCLPTTLYRATFVHNHFTLHA